MATSLASQLKVLNSLTQVDRDPSNKRPYTRPSILFDPKAAADIDIDTIFALALQGFEVLVATDERFRNFKNDLFSHQSKELDRELMGKEENKSIDVSITKFFRLLSGHFQLPSSLKTLEYLVRRYKVYVYNVDELLLCTLPYHETHAFVKIVQLINFGNSKWKFLEGVKRSGAAPPRNVIVQQCVHDMGVLEAIFVYASPSKKYRPSKPVIRFCTAVVIEVLGSVASVESDVVKRIYAHIHSVLEIGTDGHSENKAGAMMIVGMLASKVTISPALVKGLISLIAKVAEEDAKESADLQLFHLSFMTLINLVQLQVVENFPLKALESLIGIRDFAGILLGLFNKFKIDRFLSVLLDSLVDYSSSNESCQVALISILDTVPSKNFVHHIVPKVLSTCLQKSKDAENSILFSSGSWAEKVLLVLRSYPSELHEAAQIFLEKNVQSKKRGSVHEALRKMLKGNLDRSLACSESNIWFRLQHPEADVRRRTLSEMKTLSFLDTKGTNSQSLVIIQDSILRQLQDNDLTVVRAALSLDSLSTFLNPSDLVEVLNHLLRRCIGLLTSSQENNSLAVDVAILCLKNAVSVHRNSVYCDKLAALIFPLLLVLPKTQRLNLKALEVANAVSWVNWPLFENLASLNTEQTLQPGSFSSINMGTITSLASTLLLYPQFAMPWFVESSKELELSKTHFYLVMMQSVLIEKESAKSLELFEVLFPALKSEWELIESTGVHVEELKTEMLNWECSRFLDNLDSNLKAKNANILVCVFWRLIESFLSAMPADVPLDGDGKWVSWQRELFTFFSGCQLNNIFKEHRRNLVTKSKISAVSFLAKFFTEEAVPVAVQVESLNCFTYLCLNTEVKLAVQFLSEFPSLLVPLASSNQEIKNVAMNCMESLHTISSHVDSLSKKNGSRVVRINHLDKLLDLLVQQKRLILSDGNLLSSLLASLLNPSFESFLGPKNIEIRLDQSTRDEILTLILNSAMKLPEYAKLAILSLVRGTGNAIIHHQELQSYLSHLLARRCRDMDISIPCLSKIEVQILCLLLECCAVPSSSNKHVFEDYLLEALQLDGLAPEEAYTIQPCIAVLQNLNNQIYSGMKTEVQDLLFCKLVIAFQKSNGDIQNATRAALQGLHVRSFLSILLLLDSFKFTESQLMVMITCSTIIHTLNHIVKDRVCASPSVQRTKKVKSQKSTLNDVICDGENTPSLLVSLLGIISFKKDIEKRNSLLGPLFKLLYKTFSKEWVQDKFNSSTTMSSTVNYIQQTLLIILEDISSSLSSSIPVEEDIVNEINVKVLVECANSADDGVTRNHVFSLISSITKIVPEKVLEHMLDIFAVIGESTVKQIDSHSQRVFEDLLSTVVPCWLSATGSNEKLLEIFVNVLPEVAEYRRLSIVVYLLRTMGESNSLATLLILLFRSLISRIGISFDNVHALDTSATSLQREWEYTLGLQICEQYSCMVWLPPLVVLLKQIKMGEEVFRELLIAMTFILHKLQDPEFALKMASGQELGEIQSTLGELVERIISLQQVVDSRRKDKSIDLIRKSLKDCMQSVLRTITGVMNPSILFDVITKLLGGRDRNVEKKALGLLCETIRNLDMVKAKLKFIKGSSLRWNHLDENSIASLRVMCLKIVRIINDSSSDTEVSLKVAAALALEVLANRFPFHSSIFSECLPSLTKSIGMHDLALSSSCLQTTGALINVLGHKALSELPHIMKKLIKISHEVLASSHTKAISSNGNQPTVSQKLQESLILALLITLEAVVVKLGQFLSPYLEDITRVMVIDLDYALGFDQKLKMRADSVRKLITDNITVRLALPPLLNVYSKSVESGDSSLIIYFGMLANLIERMDRSSVGSYHAKIFERCLIALDLRREHPVSVRRIKDVEESIFTAMMSLSMKLTETMFRPLFIRSLDWATSDVEHISSAGYIPRAISFYGLVNKFVENHRSLFAPYFKYLLENCVHNLTVAGDVMPSGSTRKKKAKIQESDNSVFLGNWHLRALVLSSLHKCFLYDTGSPKFLDSSNFEVLLKPIVSQLVIEPPQSLDKHSDIPSVEEVDETLVVCIGQLAVTAASDLLWKPLNHEVLMQTRSDNIRARILGLRVVKYLVEHLREEYMVFIPETVPFFAELLEDVEPSVKSLAQEIFNEMSTMTGENLSQYI